MSNIGELYRIDTEFLSITSGAGATSRFYDMAGYSKALVVVAMGTFTLNVSTANIMQSADSAGATSAAFSTTVLGNTTANQITGASKVQITCSSAATDGDTVKIQGVTLTNSTAGATTAATVLGFGASAGATAASGCENIINSLASRINNTAVGLSSIMTATTNGTALILTLKDSANTYLSVEGHANFPVTILGYNKMVEIHAEDLSATGRYIGIKLSTGTTACDVAITVIREPYERPPVYQSGGYTKST